MHGLAQEIRLASRDRTWKQQLAKLLDKFPPDKNPETAEALLEKAKVVDELVWNRHQDLKATLLDYGISAENLEIREIADDVFEITVKDHFSERRLPQGYGYKGGTARALLLRTIGMDPSYIPRDIDVMSFNSTNPDVDRQVAEEFMSDDLEMSKSGNVIEPYDDDYFETRDVTINKLYATDEKIIVTKQCLLDTVRHIIRPTQYELDQFSGSL